MSGEFGLVDDEFDDAEDTQRRRVFSKPEVVAGLQAAVNSCIVVQGETDDRFRFAHDRYAQAAAVSRHIAFCRLHLKLFALQIAKQPPAVPLTTYKC